MLLEFLLFLIMIYNSIAATGTHTIVLVATHMNPSQNKDWLPFKFSSNSYLLLCTVVYPLIMF